MLVGEIMFRSQGSADAEDGSQGRFAEQDMRGLRAAVRMAQEMGARLGRGEVLFGAVPGGRRAGGLGFASARAGAGEAGRVIGDLGIGDEGRGPAQRRDRLHRREAARRGKASRRGKA